MRFTRKFLIAAAIVPMLAMGTAYAAGGTKPEAIALVKKAEAYITANGPEKAYAEFSNKTGSFVERDLYVIVYDKTGTCLAHGANAKLVGKNLMDVQDADGVYYIKDRVELMKSKTSFWQDYKFTDPTTKKIAPKSTYCERLNDTAVCVGIYK